jgi:hypothetical protein
MSFPDAKNPYASSEPSAQPGANRFEPTHSIDYGRAIGFIFENPNWPMNAIWSFLCQIVGQVIPIIPQMLFMGYQFEALDGLLASRGSRYPDFDLNRAGDYLGRAVWPFLTTVILFLVWLPLFVAYVGVAALGVIGVANSVNESTIPVVVIIGVLVALLIGMLMFSLLMIVATPFVFRAGVSQSLGAAFDFGWAWDFFSRIWLEEMLVSLFVVLGSFAISLFTCGLGSIVVMGFLPFVSTHFWYQLYVLYLSRGGTPIPSSHAPH